MAAISLKSDLILAKKIMKVWGKWQCEYWTEHKLLCVYFCIKKKSIPVLLWNR